MSKRLSTLIAILLLCLCFPTLIFLSADTLPTNIGKKVAAFEIKDVNGKLVSLADFKDKKVIVAVFIGTECPINNAFMPRLVELHKEYAPRDVQFLAINANRQDSLERLSAHARKHDLPFPVLKDSGNVVADLFAARRTPEAFVLDGERRVRYQGRIDDQFGIGFNRPKPTRRDLAEALDELLAGKPVSQSTTPVSGCLICRVAKPREKGAITFTKHIAPILQNKCQECHRPGQIGPMPLLTFDDATAWSEMMREVVEDNRMPPWHADPRYGKFTNDRRLSKEDRATLLSWIDQGTPQGDAADLPAPRAFVEGWTIGKPDLVLTMPNEFEVPAERPKNGIPYQNFFVETDFKEDRWVIRAEAKPGAAPVVHHMILFVVPPGVVFFPGNPKTPALAGTAPGDMPLTLPPGMAKLVPAGSRLLFQMHYTPNGTAYKDRSSVGLIFAKEPPKQRILTTPIANVRLRIPAGADHHQVESRFTFKHDGHLIGFMPHMHLRGKDFLYEAEYPDGKKETLLFVPRYDFNWQSIYRLSQPHPMPKGSKVHCIAHFDNSDKNRNNPDATRAVGWGDQTWEEMMIGWIDYYYDRDPD